MNAAVAALAAIAVRNPFWPIGYEGELERISPEPKVEVQASASIDAEETTTAAAAAKVAEAVATAAADSKRISPRTWMEAKKNLKVTGTSTSTSPDGAARHAVTINGYTYAEGDLISTNYGENRFTWRVGKISGNGLLRLHQVKVRPLRDDETADEGEGAKK